MIHWSLIAAVLPLLFIYSFTESAFAAFTVRSQKTTSFELLGYDGLDENLLFKGSVPAGEELTVNRPYRGLALLLFEQGPGYPVIMGEDSFTLKITMPGRRPFFMDSNENDFFYALLEGKETAAEQYSFASLMARAKELLDSSHSIRTANELDQKKDEFVEFVRSHYSYLKHSDMVRRAIAQYFMMHEYVDYHVPGEPAAKIKGKYLEAVISGAGSWLKMLKIYMPEEKVLNYILRLYYDRGMISYASMIMENYREMGFCSGTEPGDLHFPTDLKIIQPVTSQTLSLGELKGAKKISFVSSECPASFVETVVAARRLDKQDTAASVIVVPLEALSAKHLSMSRMLSINNMYFVSDEEWRKVHLTGKIQLPHFQVID